MSDPTKCSDEMAGQTSSVRESPANGPSPLACDDDTGLVDAAWWSARQDAYLAHATSVWEPRSPLNVIDHLERRRRDETWEVPLADLEAPEVAESWFRRIDDWLDCADFDMIRLLSLRLGYPDALPQQLAGAIEDRMVSFRHWYTDPAPQGIVDQRWYWSENHRLLFGVTEHLCGATFPDVEFTRTGRPGAFHGARGAERLHDWFDEKALYGFTEWHSDDYYAKDLAALITLVEFGTDAALVGRAAAFLDLFVFDMAIHCHDGTFGASHGRSYMKDKSRGVDQPTFAAMKLCFDDTSAPWRAPEDDTVSLLPRNESGTLVARAQRWRPAEVLRRVATGDAESWSCQRNGLRLPLDEPFHTGPMHRDGWGYDDPGLLAFWWDRDAMALWQVVPLTMATMDTFGLWDIDLFAPARGLREVTGGDPEVGRRLAYDLRAFIASGLLTEVDTVCWRTPHVSLANAQRYLPGRAGYQHHTWQATLDEGATVFTTHPANAPFEDPDGWDPADHYWTGTATHPLSVQHRNVVVCCYQPAYASPTVEGLEGFRYLPETHAWFPTERFDEVRSHDRWTFGRRRGAFVALWSWRPVRWRRHDPERVFTDGLQTPFDLVAEGGAANVWICEVGDRDQSGSFEDFVASLITTVPEVVEHPLADEQARGVPYQGAHGGFDVRYWSPSLGVVDLDPSGVLRVDGDVASSPDEADLSALRFATPWCELAHGDTAVRIADGPWALEVDLGTGARTTSGPTL
ncbi:MAG: hypothetical protein JJU45_08555 [Acidimicrobiia bacterium]|nr:hypothetical protein [Acidimicrobiia bacterium]